MIKGAKDAMEDAKEENSEALEYAALRNALLRKEFNVEILESYEPSLSFLNCFCDIFL